jgi:hypothetical protein
MHPIAYVSSASWNLLPEQVERIVAESRRYNALTGVTGVLLHCDGNFMQYIEGEEGADRSAEAPGMHVEWDPLRV